MSYIRFYIIISPVSFWLINVQWKCYFKTPYLTMNQIDEEGLLSFYPSRSNVLSLLFVLIHFIFFSLLINYINDNDPLDFIAGPTYFLKSFVTKYNSNEQVKISAAKRIRDCLSHETPLKTLKIQEPGIASVYSLFRNGKNVFAFFV